MYVRDAPCPWCGFLGMYAWRHLALDPTVVPPEHRETFTTAQGPLWLCPTCASYGHLTPPPGFVWDEDDPNADCVPRDGDPDDEVP